MANHIPLADGAESRPDAPTSGTRHDPAARPPVGGFLRILPFVLAALGIVWLLLDVMIFREGSRNLRDMERVSEFHRDYRDFTSAAEMIKTGSDNLTKAVRRYAATGFPRFLKAYEQEEQVDRNREHALEIINRKLPENDPARIALGESMQHSVALQETEHRALRLVAEATGLPREKMPGHVLEVELTDEERAMTPAQMRQHAIDLLYNDEYFAAKSNIWDRANHFLEGTIGKTVDNFDETSQQTIRSVTRQMILFTLALAAIFVLLIVSASVGYAQFAHMTRENLALLENLRRERDATLAAESAKSMFFSMVSHDIRTPLNAIVGFSEMLRDGVEDPKERAEDLENILFSAHTLLSLVNDVLDLSKLDAEKMVFTYAPCDFQALLRRVADTFRFQTAQKKVEMRVSCGSMPPLVLDEERIRQILVNLVSNAVKFTEIGFVELAADYADGTLRFSVRDTGCGISPEDQPRVLEPFVQTTTNHAGGTGLGLPICRSLAEHMGGKLLLESELGRGSVFSIVIPDVKIADEPPPVEQIPIPVPVPEPVPAMDSVPVPSPPPPSATPESPPATPVNSALIVDDVPVNLMVEQALLRRFGISEVTTAASAAEALATLDKHGPFDLILTDLWMPEMDGYALCDNLRADPRWKDLPIYAVTADVEARKSIVSRGFDGILLKPVTKETLGEFLAGSPTETARQSRSPESENGEKDVKPEA